MATVFSRPLKSGGVRWFTKVKQSDGSWDQVPLPSARSKPQAMKLAVEIQASNERLLHGIDGGELFEGTFGELCEWAWKIHFKDLGGAQSDASRLEYHGGAKGLRPPVASKRGIKRAADGWQSPLANMPAKAITRQVLERFFDELAQKTTVRGSLMSASAINRVRAVFSKVFALAADRGMLPDNPAGKTRQRAAHATERSSLALDEVARVLEATEDYWRGVFAVGMLAGLRKGEIFGLKKVDVDLTRGRLLVRRSHQRDRTKGQRGQGAAAPEPVPIHPALMPFIMEAMKSPGPLLFPARDGQIRKEKTKVERIMRSAMVRAGIVEHYDHKCRRKGCRHVEQHADDAARECPKCHFRLWPVGVPRDICFHGATRHTLASQALMAGASIAAVQKILRHKDPRLTMRVYAHLAPDYLADELGMMVIPGLEAAPASPSDGGPRGDGDGEAMEHPAPSRIDSDRRAAGRGDMLVSADGAPRLRSVGGGRSSRKQGGLSVEPRGIEPLTYALRKPPRGAPPVSSGYPAHGSAANSGSADSNRHQPNAPVITGRGVPMVREGFRAHHGAALCITPGFGDEPPAGVVPRAPKPAPLLTVRQVADRLQVSAACVYRQVEIGELGHSRFGNAIRISEADLAAYLARGAR